MMAKTQMTSLLAGFGVAALAVSPARALELHSSAFQNGGQIPATYTCDGSNVSPPLVWSGVPAAAKSLALIVDDPDAPGGTWVHWVVYDLPAVDGQLAEGTTASRLPPGAHGGVNDFHKADYGGPCPPAGRHRYAFKLYALDAVLPDLGAPSSAQLQSAMTGHVVAQAALTGTYAKNEGK